MNRFSIQLFATLAFGISVISGPSFSYGQITPVSRSSSVIARETLSTLLGTTSVVEEAESSSDFLSFIGQVDAGNADASQSSSLSLQSLQVSTFADAGSAGTEFGSTSASSVFNVVFTIDSPTEFNLVGTLLEDDFIESAGFNGGGSSITLTSDATTFEFFSDFENTVSLDETGILAPDTYTLEISSSGIGSIIEPSATTSTDVTITFTSVPEPSHATLLALTTLVSCVRRKKRA